MVKDLNMKSKIVISIGIIFLISFTYFLFAQDVELIFSHKYHAEEVEAACTECHKAEESTQATDNLLPNMETCYSCHDEENTECTVCHKDPDNAIEYPRITAYISNFSHNKHINDKMTCEKCHVKVAASENILKKHLPKMALCVGCHTDISKDDYCYTCHDKERDLKPRDHKLAWKENHGIVVKTEEESCDMCHTRESCLECHSSDNLDRNAHSLNYANNHGLYAKGNKDNCYTCHEELSFCVDCHQKRMVMPRNHSYANWSNMSTGGGHGRAAKLDLDSCLSCHSDAQGDPVCVVCHKQ